jgi:hypothetical protein
MAESAPEGKKAAQRAGNLAPPPVEADVIAVRPQDRPTTASYGAAESLVVSLRRLAVRSRA